MEPLKRPKGRNINTSGALALLNKSVRAGRYIDSPSPFFFVCWVSTHFLGACRRASASDGALPFVSIPTVDSPTLWPSSRLHPLLAMSFIHWKKTKKQEKTSKRSFSIDILYTVKKKKPDRPSASSFQARSFLCVLCRPYVYAIICCEPSAGKPESVLLTEANSHQKWRHNSRRHYTHRPPRVRFFFFWLQTQKKWGQSLQVLNI